MNKFQKYLSSTLAALMIAGCGTITFAKNFDDVTDDTKEKTEISILTDIGVIKGTEDNLFSPDETVTREQMAAFLFRLMLGRDNAGRVNTTGFKDLYEPYYNGAISWANAAGYILGTSKTTFEPTGGITKQDAMTMLVRALGQDNDKMNDNYPWSYINAGVKLGLDKGLDGVEYDETLTRAETAVILYNALTAEYMVGKTTVGGNIYYESTSIIEEVFGYSIAEAVLVSTNDYTLEENKVVKNGYVTLKCTNDESEFYMTVPYAELGLSGDENSHIGKSFKVIYNSEAGRYSVLSAVEMSKTETFDSVTISGNTVKIGENKYTLVTEYSDELSTNNNEIILYAYDTDGKLDVIENLDELKELLGFYRVSLVFDEGSDTAKRGLVRVYEMGKLDIDDSGRINIAGNNKKEDLDYSNKTEAKDGDYVLFYYNSNAKELEIAETLEVVEGTVKRITETRAKIGDKTFSLGNATAGISAEYISEKLVLGTSATVVVHNESIVSVIEGVTISDSSQYLLALSDAHRVYENGMFRYVMTAYVNGAEKNIYVDNNNAVAGKVYRYTENADIYDLIDIKIEDGIIISGKKEFIQNVNGIDEMAYTIDSADGTTIELGGRNYYTINRGNASSTASVAGLSNIKFVTDKNTVIIVNNNGTIMQRTGIYNSSITVNDGAKVVAVFNNEVGSVETLKYLYISDGELGNYDLDAEFVRVLGENGYVFENGVTYVEYIVYNFASGKTETMLSKHSDLEIGNDYRCGNDNTITDEEADVVTTGFVTGYTANTVTIDGTTFVLAEGVKIIKINSDGSLSSVALSSLYMKNVEFIADHGEIKLLIEGDAAKFEATASSNTVEITPDFDLEHFSGSELKAVSLKKGENDVSLEGAVIEIVSGNKINVTLAENLEAGDYILGFKLGGKTFSVNFSIS